jgi:hypothetical protein
MLCSVYSIFQNLFIKTQLNISLDMSQNINVIVASTDHHKYAVTITDEMEASAKARGTGIAKRSPDYIIKKMDEGKAVIALTDDGEWVGFCYIETWDGDYVANSGLIVSPNFRKSGVAKKIKETIFKLSRKKYPKAKIFGLTTGLAVMKINSDLGYEPVTYSELTKDEKFWEGCKSCVNFDILTMKERKNCLCTAMLYDPEDHYEPEETQADFKENSTLYERFTQFKKYIMLKYRPGKDAGGKTSGGSTLLKSLRMFFS